MRDWLTKESGWDRASDQKPPALPEEVVEATSRRYEEAWARLTGGQVSDEASDERPQNEADCEKQTLRADDGPSEECVAAAPAAIDVPGEPDSRSADRIGTMSRVVVEVMPKPEILDPQGKAITSVLARLGHEGLTVRQGKRFEITGDGLEDRLDEIRQVASELLANTVIESFDVHVED